MTIAFLALFRPYEAFSRFLAPTYQRRGDDGFWRKLFFGRKALWINALAIFWVQGGVFAQETNQACYQRLVLQHLNQPGQGFRRVSGYDEEFLLANVKIDTNVSKSLLVAEPEVRFSKLEDGRFLRTIDLGIQHLVSDSLVAEFAEFMRDTLDADGYKLVRKGADAVLRGNDPRFWANFLVPAAFVASGITGIISLFYIRSN